MAVDHLFTDVLSASDFNRIRLFEEQAHTVRADDLLAVGQIFVATNMHHDWAAGLLHRHHTIQEGFIMVHELDQGQDICRAVPLASHNSAPLRPNSFFLNPDKKFQPFEHDFASQRPQFREDFLHDILSVFLDRDLSKLLAIIPNPTLHGGLQDAVAYQLSDEQGTICIPRTEAEKYGHVTGELVITGWNFCPTKHGDIYVNDIKECKEQPSGYYKRVPKPPAK